MSKELAEELLSAASVRSPSCPLGDLLEKAARYVSHLPDREEVLQEAVKELRMSAVMNCEGNADFLDGIEHAISRIRSLMERKA